MNWEELRFFHAVARAGSLAQAARDLKVSQPTVGRRIRDLERRLKTGLFDRLTHGYALTETGRTILEKVEQMACTARSIDDCVSTAAREVAGRVRVTASEGIGAFWLVPQLEQLRRRHPKLDVALMLSTEKLDLSAGAADLALRMGNPKDEKLIGRRIADVAFHLYATRGYFERFGVPTRPEELSGHAIIESAGRLAHLPQGVAIRQLAPGAEIAAAFDSITAQAQAAEAGLGLVPLPPYLVADKPDLLRVPPGVFEVRIPLWLLTRADLRNCARITAVKAHILEGVRSTFAVPEDTVGARAPLHRLPAPKPKPEERFLAV